MSVSTADVAVASASSAHARTSTPLAAADEAADDSDEDDAEDDGVDAGISAPAVASSRAAASSTR